MALSRANLDSVTRLRTCKLHAWVQLRAHCLGALSDTLMELEFGRRELE